MSPVAAELVFIVVLILANGVFALSEIAVVSARKARLQQRANEGDAKAQAALELANAPNDFLATVQVGITLVGILAGAFGGATIAEEIGSYLGAVVPALTPYSKTVGLLIVVVSVTYLSLIIGELVPKQIGLNAPEQIASVIAPPMRVLSRIAQPLVRFLSFSTAVVLKLLRVQPSDEAAVTEEEIKVMLDQGTQTGTFDKVERDMVDRVFRLGDLQIGSVMTPRTEIVWFDVHDSPAIVRQKMMTSRHSRFPVADGSLDNVLGVARAGDLLTRCLANEPLDLRVALQTPLYVPETTSALRTLQLFRESGVHVALVIDEYGGLQGLVTINSFLGEIISDVFLPYEQAAPQAVQRADGSWLLDGLITMDEFKTLLQIKDLPGEQAGMYRTLGGFVMTQIGHIPAVADSFEVSDYRVEVVDMDGYRVDKVLITLRQPPQ
ncbi:MAG: HlyC/CorC family transporter [Anaerolineae bacterium]|nr:HlyC/CorC family transporter [Anaerolineae bacterium]